MECEFQNGCCNCGKDLFPVVVICDDQIIDFACLWIQITEAQIKISYSARILGAISDDLSDFSFWPIAFELKIKKCIAR